MAQDGAEGARLAAEVAALGADVTEAATSLEECVKEGTPAMTHGIRIQLIKVSSSLVFFTVRSKTL